MKLTFGCREVDDIAVLFEHVDFLNCLNRLNIHLFQRSLQLFVISGGRFVHFLGLAARSSFASVLCGQDSSQSAWILSQCSEEQWKL